MRNPNSLFLKICLVSLFLVFFCKVSYAGVDDWTTYTNMNDVKQVILKGDSLWCVTTGGVAVFNVNDGIFTKLTNVDGLGETSFTP